MWGVKTDVGVSVCGRSGLWPFRFVAFLVCGRSGLWPFRFVAVSVCGRFGLWPFRFVAVSVCGRFGCGRFGLWPLWPVTPQMTFSNSIKISLNSVPKCSTDNIPALVQIMGWHQTGNKRLSEPMMVKLLTHICVTWPQWVETSQWWNWYIWGYFAIDNVGYTGFAWRKITTTCTIFVAKWWKMQVWFYVSWNKFIVTVVKLERGISFNKINLPYPVTELRCDVTIVTTEPIFASIMHPCFLQMPMPRKIMHCKQFNKNTVLLPTLLCCQL